MHHLIIHIMSLPLSIPNKSIRRCPRGQQTNPNNVAKTTNGNHYSLYTTGILWIEEDITLGSPWRGEIKMATAPLHSRGPHGGENST